ncbi:hypothetical protein FB451DRAFT_1364346 [Mycena latifolia]|nr:hypothetical protein FB451DRAFT_1364346 [Mycena latifolia]
MRGFMFIGIAAALLSSVVGVLGTSCVTVGDPATCKAFCRSCCAANPGDPQCAEPGPVPGPCVGNCNRQGLLSMPKCKAATANPSSNPRTKQVGNFSAKAHEAQDLKKRVLNSAIGPNPVAVPSV